MKSFPSTALCVVTINDPVPDGSQGERLTRLSKKATGDKPVALSELGFSLFPKELDSLFSVMCDIEDVTGILLEGV